MDWFRIRHTLALHLIMTGGKRAEYIKKHHVFANMGENCIVMFRKVPLHSKLISIGNNVRIASNVTFVTHDVIHKMLNTKYAPEKVYPEFKGCIEIKDNVFIGANTTVLSNVLIGPNVIIGACSLVNKDISEGVYAGVPAKYICSLEDFLAKRYPNAESKDEKSDESLWKQFYCERKPG
ncbi:MAG: acyltransferase [Ruminococcus sp.]